MKNSTKIILGLIIIVVIVALVIGNGEAEPGKYDLFAQCITEKGAIMYGAYWCPHCQSQKELFGSSFQYVNYVECDARGDNGDPAACEAAGIEGFPTWIFTDGEKKSGEVTLQELAFRTGCELPQEASI